MGARTRKDVTVEKVAELRNKGLTIPEIAKELNCGINTVNRRLGMKDYWIGVIQNGRIT